MYLFSHNLNFDYEDKVFLCGMISRFSHNGELDCPLVYCHNNLDLTFEYCHNNSDSVLWAFKTTYKTLTSHTLFQLVYGTEAVLPIEFIMASLRVVVL